MLFLLGIPDDDITVFSSWCSVAVDAHVNFPSSSI